MTTPTPSFILRGHSAQISILRFSPTTNELFSGDVDGWISVWNLNAFRPRLFWKAHEAGILSIEELPGGILTHGRDNKVHFQSIPKRDSTISRSAAVPSSKDPSEIKVLWTLDVNAMAYCKLSLMAIPDRVEESLIAVPSLTKDELIDVFHLPSLDRVHRSVGANLSPIGDKTGTLMAVSLISEPALHLLGGFEDGRVALFRFTGTDSQAFDPPTRSKEEGELWELIWEEKGHREALMAISVSPDQEFAFSISADHFICKYRMFNHESKEPRMQKFETSAPGRAAIDIRDDGRLFGVSGWDGEVRLYSVKSGKPLAVLSYHRDALHAFAFAPSLENSRIKAEESESEDEEEQRVAWIAAGGTETTISLWKVY